MEHSLVVLMKKNNLQEAINRIIQEFGKDIIAEKRFVYMIADYYSFRDNPAEKRVLSALVNDGYTARLLDNKEGSDISIVTNQIVEEVCRNYGFRKDLVSDILTKVMKGIGVVKAGVVQEKSQYKAEYTEEIIVGLFKSFFDVCQKNYHTQIHLQDILSILHLDHARGYRLLCFLEKMGALKYFCYDTYLIVPHCSENLLRDLYRDYVTKMNKYKYNNLSYVIKHYQISNAIRNLFYRGSINIELLAKDLNSDIKYAERVCEALEMLKIIDAEGRCKKTPLSVSEMTKKVMNVFI